MHHLDRQRRVDRGDAFFDEILDRLDVVIGGRFEFLHAARIVEREVLVNGAELFRGRGGNWFQRADLGVPGERQVPFDLDADPVANQRELAEVCLQAPGARAVAAVNRRHRGQCRVGLGWFVFHAVLIELNYATTHAQSRGALIVQRPVCPKPPGPREVGASSSTSTMSARMTGAMMSWAMRSPGLIKIGCSPK